MTDTRHPTLAPIYDEKIAVLEGEIERLRGVVGEMKECAVYLAGALANPKLKDTALTKFETVLSKLSG